MPDRSRLLRPSCSQALRYPDTGHPRYAPDTPRSRVTAQALLLPRIIGMTNRPAATGLRCILCFIFIPLQVRGRHLFWLVWMLQKSDCPARKTTEIKMPFYKVKFIFVIVCNRGNRRSNSMHCETIRSRSATLAWQTDYRAARSGLLCAAQ